MQKLTGIQAATALVLEYQKDFHQEKITGSIDPVHAMVVIPDHTWTSKIRNA